MSPFYAPANQHEQKKEYEDQSRTKVWLQEDQESGNGNVDYGQRHEPEPVTQLHTPCEKVGQSNNHQELDQLRGLDVNNGRDQPPASTCLLYTSDAADE